VQPADAHPDLTAGTETYPVLLCVSLRR